MSNIKNAVAFLHNAGSFLIYLVGQQLVLLPCLAQKEESVYCQAVIFVTVMNILGSVIGDEAGNCWLVRYEDYRQKKLSPFPDILRILLIMSLLSGSILCLLAYFFKAEFIFTFCGLLCIWLCAVRFILSVYFRKNQKYTCLIWCYLFYCAGMFIGYRVFLVNGQWIFIFLCAEAAALLYNLPAAGCSRNTLTDLKLTVTSEYKNSWILYIQLALTSLLLLGALYLDKFILYRLLDTTDLTVYFAAAAMSKLVFLLGNPLYSFLLAKLSDQTADSDKKIIGISIYLSLFLFVVCTFGTVFFMYAGMYLFYNTHLVSSYPLFLPLSLASGAGMAIVILRSVVIRFRKKWMLLTNTVFYCFFILLSGWLLTIKYGNAGMGWAVAGGQFIQAAGLLFILCKGR